MKPAEPASRIPALGALLAWSDEHARVSNVLVPALVVVVALILGVTTSSYWTFLGTSAVINALLALSVGIVFNRAGMLALCPLSFAALGTWVAGWLTVHHAAAFPLLVLCAIAVAVPAGIIVGALAVRLRGMNLAIVTMGLAEVTVQLLGVIPIPGSQQGTQVPRPGFAASQSSYFLLCLTTLVIIGVVITWCVHGRLGASWMMLRSERATAASGTNVVGAKLSVFVVSGAIAAVAGVLLAGQTGNVDSSSFAEPASLQIVVIAILVGAGRMEGAVIAGVLGAFFSELLLRLGISANLAGVFFGVGAIQILSKGDLGAAGHQQAKRAANRVRRLELRRAQASQASSPGPPARVAEGSRVAGPPVNVSPSVGAEPLLEVRGLTVQYGAVRALDDVSFCVDAAQIVGLIGPNGAGKTTLLDAVTGFAPLSAGTLTLDGLDLRGMPPHLRARAGVRRTFQQVRIAEELTVERYVRFAVGGRLSPDDLDSALELFGCTDRGRRIGTLDVPSRRLVELAAAVAARPRVLLLDEPAAGLGEAESTTLAASLLRVSDQFGVALVLIEHDIDVVTAACSSVTVLDYGKVLASGDPAEVLRGEDVRAAYLGVGGAA